MKDIGIIAEGRTAHFFIQKLLSQYHTSNHYSLISQDPELISTTHPDNFTFHCFDPSSEHKLQKALPSDCDQIFLIHQDTEERQAIYKLLRRLFPKTPIILHTQESLQDQESLDQDPLLEEVFTPLIVANKLLSYLPNIPTPSQDIGLGKGELMEIPVPSGSVYCYRTLGSIAQKDWRIVGIYRKEELLLSSYTHIIQPNDRLLAIGNPKILSNVYRQITSSLGQFPIPFGKDLFLYLDEDVLSENEILKDLSDALYLHKHLNSKQLIITILNPKRFELLEHIKSIQDKEIQVSLSYQSSSLSTLLREHQSKRIGLAILNAKLFANQEVKRTLFELSIPLCKTAQTPIQDCSYSLVLLESDENIASVTFDIASQLGLDLEIYDFEVDGHYHDECFAHYRALSQIYGKPIRHIQNNTQNPIRHIQNLKTPILQFIPFHSSIISDSLLNIASTQLSYHSATLSQHPQILIPTSYANPPA